MTLASLPCLWLTTLRGDGSPHTTPVWFLLDESTIWIASASATVKVRNAVRDERVSMAFDATSDAPAVAEGTSVVHDLSGDGAAAFRATLERFASKYDGWDAADPSLGGPRVLLEVSITRWLLRPSV